MLVNRDECVKVMIDQNVSNAETYEIITKEEAAEHLLEVTTNFTRYISHE